MAFDFTIEGLEGDPHLLLKIESGSRAYGLNTPQSDYDFRGVFILPKPLFYGFNRVDQVASEKNDIVYFELEKYLQLLGKNNPTAIEMLFTQGSSILVQNPLLGRLDSSKIVSKLCLASFAGYALNQIRRATGLNKKIFKPWDGPEPRPRDFCYVIQGSQTKKLKDWLADTLIHEKELGLTALPHVTDGYALYHSKEFVYSGLFRPLGQDLVLSSIPKGLSPIGWLVYNKNDYSLKIKEYRNYLEWEKNRNQDRFDSTLAHGRGYDAKNMMHTFRLLAMAKDIAETGRPQIRRPDRDFLLKIKAGEFEYQELIDLAEQQLEDIQADFAKADLPDEPDLKAIEEWAVEIRDEFYLRRLVE